jgi:hypothetical protein
MATPLTRSRGAARRGYMSIPSAVVVALFALIATIKIGRIGFARRED